MSAAPDLMQRVADLERERNAALAEAQQLRHLLGSHADGHLCYCEMTRPGNHIEPPEWEQNPWCPTHPNMDYVLGVLADVTGLAKVQARSCQAQHRADHARNWLDLLAIIERSGAPDGSPD